MRLMVTLARALVGWPAPRPRRAFRALLPLENPLETEDGQAARQEAALKLMDPDCYGFLVLSVHASAGMEGRVELAAHIRQEWWPAVSATLEQIIEAHHSRL